MDESFMQLTGMRVISGGQTGVDLAALRAAQCMGFRTGGTAPFKWRTQAGPKPELTMFGLTEGSSFSYSERTETNVLMSDATLLVYQHGQSPGTDMTRKLAKRHDRPLFEVQLGVPADLAAIVRWLKVSSMISMKLYGGFTLNVAGNSSASAPGIWAPAFLFLLDLFKELAKGSAPHEDADRQQLYINLKNPQLYMQLDDNFIYFPELDFRNRYNGQPIDLVSSPH